MLGIKLPDMVSPSAPNAPIHEGIIRLSKVLLEWDSPERLFKKRSREFYRKVAVIIIFFALLLLIIKEFLLIGVLGVVFFVVYVFHTVPPRIVHHQITTNGINFASEHIYPWSELRGFFIDEKDGVKILNVDTKAPLPGRISMLLDKSIDYKKAEAIVNEYLSIVENPEISMAEKLMSGISSRISI
ncbi:hypothetical protein A2982_01980 [candidate division WWE3 bacterium RIFCSPLOWO2_01_FULL_39_13]|uniref:DUF5673 domain-containing protein n=1 Tax=candidate division WWE3 bacterium RIFCSPLOWO2_01_FULL_39_13 TaxID=1802624 RepID=A0A1F4V386_UNCKA|nr:MAG: hypothetical protein A2982_01980 [candidate division WWE3 bacterium RIFCSPLOWO2_01_FULL_39_13]